MLDKYSEKVLKHIAHYQLNLYDDHPIPNFQSRIDNIDGVDPNDIRNILKQLDNNGYITANMNATHIGSVSITHLGKHYLEISKKEKNEEYIKSIREWLNVGIAFLALITAIIALFV